MSKLIVKKIPGPLNSIVLEQDKEGAFFVGTPLGLVISIPTLARILTYLVSHNYMDYQVLQGVLSEYFTDKGEVK